MSEPRRPSIAARFVLTTGGLGLLPWMPGTWGTLGALAAALVVAPMGWFRGNWYESVGAVVVIGLALLVHYVPRLEAEDGKDPQVVVLDEVIGYATALLFVPGATATELVATFFVFRLFDILKLWPASRLERLRAGWGVALDDVAAGAYTGLCLLIARSLY